MKTIVITNKNISFKNIVIPEKLNQLSTSKIAKYAFVNCKFETCILPETIEYIDYGAFLGCENLISITIPKNVKFIGAGAFGNCPNLKTLIFEGDIPKFGKLWDKETIFDYNP